MEDFNNFDLLMMRRALQLAQCGEGRVSPNPMVGAVITARGEIIGEGYHRQYGGPHAEVNAMRSLTERGRSLISEATMYVTLEPCAHYGKTPPCAVMLAQSGIAEVVIAMTDPFPKVDGKGIDILRSAGIRVLTGLLGDEAEALNRRFITAHTLRRPYIQLKWAQSTDGYIAAMPDMPRAIFSTPLSTVWMHRERAKADAIMTGVNTVALDNPRLDCRVWPGRRPAAVSFDSPRLPADARICDGRPLYLRNRGESLEDFMTRLYTQYSVTSLMVEGGTQTLQEFIDQGIFDEIRIETAPCTLAHGIKAPEIDTDSLKIDYTFNCRDNNIKMFRQ